MTDALTVGALFAGIGGLELGLERTGGFRTRWVAEVDPYASAVLRRRWPDVPNLGDVRGIGADAPPVDVLAGGFPCQPVSLAGRRLGEFDPRWLWPEFARLVGLLRPRIVLVENVPGLVSKGLRDVLTDLAALGYDAEWDVVSAASVGAPHLRERIFLVSYPNGQRQPQRRPGRAPEEVAIAGGDGTLRPLADADGEAGRPARSAGPEVFRPEAVERLGRRRGRRGGPWAVEPDMGRVAHGIPDRSHRLRALGNAVVPQVAAFVGHLILEAAQEGRL